MRPIYGRRRPLLRGAMLAGTGAVAYRAGKRSQANAQHEDDQDQQIAAMQTQQNQAQQEATPAVPAPAAPSTDTVTELERLKALLDQGALTQAEFDAAKQQILQGGQR